MAQEMTPLGAAADYWIDAWQRGALFLETLNEPPHLRLRVPSGRGAGRRGAGRRVAGRHVAGQPR